MIAFSNRIIDPQNPLTFNRAYNEEGEEMTEEFNTIWEESEALLQHVRGGVYIQLPG